MFERYTESARRLLFFARFEATQLGMLSIEVEHLLIGLLYPETGASGAALERTGLRLGSLRNEFRPAIREAVSPRMEIPFTAAAKRVLEHATAEADALSSADVGPEHLLIGIVREDASRASQLLSRHGITLELARAAAGGRTSSDGA